MGDQPDVRAPQAQEPCGLDRFATVPRQPKRNAVLTPFSRLETVFGNVTRVSPHRRSFGGARRQREAWPSSIQQEQTTKGRRANASGAVPGKEKLDATYKDTLAIIKKTAPVRLKLVAATLLVGVVISLVVALARLLSSERQH